MFHEYFFSQQTIVNAVDYIHTVATYAMRELLSLAAKMVNGQAEVVGAEEEEEKAAAEDEQARAGEAGVERVAKLMATRGKVRKIS